MIAIDQRVHVFRNWKHDCYSIMAVSPHGVTMASARQVLLGEVEFRVRAEGRAAMLKRERKNLHAFAVGRLLDFVHPDHERQLEPVAGRTVFYDPHRFAYFADSETHAPVAGADLVQLDERGVTYQLA